MPLYDSINETYLHVANELSKIGIVYLHVVDYAARQKKEGHELVRSIRNQFTNALILNGGYTKERAAGALTRDGADLISFGTPFISNPDLPKKFINDLPLTPADASTFYTADEKGYVDY